MCSRGEQDWPLTRSHGEKDRPFSIDAFTWSTRLASEAFRCGHDGQLGQPGEIEC